jgi:hypothetical protein
MPNDAPPGTRVLATPDGEARAHLAPGEGHLTLAARSFGAVLDDLLDLAGQPPVGSGAAAGSG